MVATKESLYASIAETYHLDAEGAKRLAEYDQRFRKNLNSHELAAEMVTSGKFELKDDTVTSFGKLLSDAAGMIPVAGQTFSFLGSLVSRGAKKYQENEEERLARKFEEINPELDHAKWCELTRSIAENIAREKVDEITECKSKKEVQKLADKDSEKVIRGILIREEGRESDRESLIPELTAIALSPDSITKPTDSKQTFAHIFHRLHDTTISS